MPRSGSRFLLAAAGAICLTTLLLVAAVEVRQAENTPAPRGSPRGAGSDTLPEETVALSLRAGDEELLKAVLPALAGSSGKSQAWVRARLSELWTTGEGALYVQLDDVDQKARLRLLPTGGRSVLLRARPDPVEVQVDAGSGGSSSIAIYWIDHASQAQYTFAVPAIVQRLTVIADGVPVVSARVLRPDSLPVMVSIP